MFLKDLVMERFGEDLALSSDIEELDLTDITKTPMLTQSDKEYLEKYKGIASLCLSKLGLKSLKNFPKLESIFLLNLNINKLEIGLKEIADSMPHLSELELEYNKFKNISEFEHLKSLVELTSITLHGNPITKIPNYREQIFNILPNLVTIDDYCRDGRDHLLHLIQKTNGCNSIEFSEDLTKTNLSPELIKELYQSCKEEEELDKEIELDAFPLGSDYENEKEEPERKKRN